MSPNSREWTLKWVEGWVVGYIKGSTPLNILLDRIRKGEGLSQAFVKVADAMIDQGLV